MLDYLKSSWSYGGDIGVARNKTQILRDIEAPTAFGLSKSSLWRSKTQAQTCAHRKPTWEEFQSELRSRGDFDVTSPIVFHTWQGIMNIGYKPSYTEEAIQYVIRELTYTPQRFSEEDERADERLDRRAHGLYAADNFEWSEGLFGEDDEEESAQLQRNLQVSLD